jgi:acyl-coenzyme A synthetase/AMP-(fatty) acid ligase
MAETNPLFRFFTNQAAQAGGKPCVQTVSHTLYHQDVLNYTGHFSALYKIIAADTLILNINNPLLLYVFCWTALANNCNLVLLPAIQQPALLNEYAKEMQNAKIITDIEACKGEGVFYTDKLPGPELLPAVLPGIAAEDQHCQDDKQIFFFSSGTTSVAKMVSTSYSQLLLALNCISKQNLMPYTYRQTVFITPPLYHSYGFSAMMEYSINGSTIVLPEERNFTGYLKTIANAGLSAVITAVEGVPYYHEQLKLAVKRCKLNALQHIGFGGDAVPMSLMEFYRAYSPAMTFSVRYGLTEIPSVISLLYLCADEPLQNNGTKVMPFFTFQFNNGASKTEGEIWVAYNNTAAEAYGISNLSEAFIFTGDTGYLAGNSLHITGRKKHLGKVKGFTVNTLVLENFLCRHSAIQEAAVIIENGELQVRAVAPTLTVVDISEMIKTALPPHYEPGKIELVNNIERTETGKIIRHSATTKQS